MKKLRLTALILAVLTLLHIAAYAQTKPATDTTSPAAQFDPALLNSYQEQLHFINNKGQWDGNDLYRAQGPATTVQVRKNGFMLSVMDPETRRQMTKLDDDVEYAHSKHLPRPNKSINVQQHAWEVTFEGMNPNAEIQPVSEENTYSNYLIGNDPGKTTSKVKTYDEVWYKDVYKNVDVRLYASEDQSLEYDLIIKPGGNTDEVRLRYEGLSGLRIDDQGQLQLKTIFGESAYPKPVAYQVVNGKRVPVKCSYKLSNENIVGFTVGKYDKSLPLLIDPIALHWAAYISYQSTATSGSADGHNHGIEVDDTGNVYVTGRTTANNFPTTTGVIQTTYTGGTNTQGFVCKLVPPSGINGAGAFAWSTYIGGTGGDNFYSIKLDASNNIYLTGYTSSSNFPSTVGNGYQGGEDVFVTKINNSGTSIVWSELLGGTGDDNGDFLYVAPAGDVYVCGSTASSGFPTTTGAYQTTYGGGTDAFWTHLSSTGSILYSTFYGGSDQDGFTCVRAIGSSLVFVGSTQSTSGIATSGAFQTSYVGDGTNNNGLVVQFNNVSTTPTLAWGTYINPSYTTSTSTHNGHTTTTTNYNQVTLLSEQVDGSGNVYFGGLTTGASTAAITSGVYQTTYGGNTDFYLGKLNSTGNTLSAGTYVGGSGEEVNFMGLNIDSYGNVYCLGYTESTNSTLPATSGAMQTNNEGDEDAVFFKISPTYTTMDYLTYWGGTNNETDPIGFDGIKFENCKTYTALTVYSTDAPMTQGSFQAIKTSSTSVDEPAIAEWGNPPDLGGDTLSGNETICSGATPALPITAPAAYYELSNIDRGGTISAQNSPGGITYSWQESTDGVNWTVMTGDTSQNLTAAQVGPLTQTTYFERIVSGDYCQGAVTSIITKTVSKPSPVLATDSVSCNGRSDAVIDITPSGGVSPYTYHWNTGATTQDLSGLSAGTYTVTITDAIGCTTTASATTSQPPVLTVSLSGTNPSCDGSSNGSVTATYSGGNGIYTYNWSNGATTANLASVTAGTYTVTVTDGHGCTATTGSSITLTNPAQLTVGLSGVNPSCYGNTNGSVAANVTGGTGTYTYLWSNSATTSSLTGLSSGTYNVTVTDANHCTTTGSPATITNPAQLTVSISGTSPKCYGASTGSVTSTVSGGTGAYTYSWSNGTTTTNLGNVAAGTYNVTVTDANHCTATAISVTLTNPVQLTVSLSGTNPACYGASTGSVTSTVSGGTGTHTYLWSNSATTANLSNVAAGTYTITVTDANGCTVSSNSTLSNPAQLTASLSGTNPACYGGSTGSMTATISGGTGADTYLWSNSATTQNISNVVAGTYTITVTDANHCTVSSSSTLSNPAQLTVSLSGTNPACYGASTGSVTSTVSGGTGSRTYLWNNSATTANLSNVPAGTYNVTVTDANGCTATATAVTLTNPAQLTVSLSGVNPACYGASTGSVTATVSGGTGSHTYLWSNSATTANLSNVAAGTYNVTVTDANGCTATATAVTLTNPAQLTVSLSGVNPACYGASTGSVTATVSGGTGSHTYLWSNSATTANLSNVAAGTYNITVTDANGCTATATAVTLTNPAQLTVSLSGVNPACYGASTGSVTSSVSGGTGSHTYLWSNSATTANLSNVAAGTYNVTVTDANGCTATATAVTLTNPAQLTVSLSGVNPACYGASTGSVTATVSGGTGSHTYLWSNSATTANLSNVAAGTYNVTVTDANGCTATATVVTLTNPAQLTVSLSGVNPACYGASTGSVTATVSGGTGSHTYLWSNSATTANLSNVAAGTYNVTVTDANGCTATATAVTLTNPAQLTVSLSGVNPACYGASTGSVTATVSGGTGSHTYLWSNSATTANLSNVAAGTYNVTVTDANGCTATATVVTLTNPAQLTVSLSGVNPACYGASTGSVTSTVSGGTGADTYLWSNSATSSNLSNVAAGTYNVTVSDANHCTATATAATLTNPAQLTLSVTQTDSATCNGTSTGSVNISASGGTGSYSYNWSNGKTTQNISNLAAGTYTVTVTDAHGCTATTSSTVYQPVTLGTSITATDSATCNGSSTGSINISVTGGTPVYTYNWSNGKTAQNISTLAAGTYTVTVTDVHGCSATTSSTVNQPAALVASVTATDSVTCNGSSTGSINISVTGGTPVYTYNWSNGKATQNISSLAAGTYTVTVTDVHGCSATTSSTVYQPVSLAASISATDSVTCNGTNTGSINISVSGGTPVYTYNWSNGKTTQNISSLAAGTYTVTVTDVHGCSATTSSTVYQPVSLAASISATDSVTCNGTNTGSINISVSGGTPVYTYNWSNGKTTQNISSLAAGTYTVTVTDVHGCSVTTSSTVNQPATLAASITATDSATCNGTSTGSINISVSGGTPVYTYNWSNGKTTQNISSLAAGTYTVTVTDVHGCSVTTSSTVNQPATLAASITATDSATCNGTSTGSINISVSGGTPVYTYNWSNGKTTQNISSLAAGTYTVTVTDVHGCSVTTSSTVNQPATLAASITATDSATCNGTSTGSINISVSGGTPVYTYNWSNGKTTQNISSLAAGTYTVTVTDVHGCSVTTSSTVNQPATLAASITATDSATCNGTSTGSINISVSGGTPVYTYNWSNGKTTQNIGSLAAGTYTVTVTDVHGCSATSSSTVYQPATLTASIAVTDSATCNGTSTGSINISVSGGTPVYTYNWSNGKTTQNISSLAAGTYTVTVTDVHGCSVTTSSTVNQPATLAASITATDSATCNGTSTGSINISVTGGTPVYSYIWSNGKTTQNISSLAAGTYTVTVTDVHGCSVTTSSTVNQPATLAASITATDSATCNGTSTGSVNISVTGGTPVYSYIWSNGKTTQNISSLAAGTYTVTVTDVHGCSATTSSTVKQPVLLTVNVTATDSATCNGTNTGGVQISAAGGTGPYSYNWSNGATTQNIGNLIAGTYSVTITDVHGCTATTSDHVYQASTLDVSVTATDSVTCNGTSNGAIQISPAGGTGPYSYSWSNGATTQNINNLPSSSYTVTVTDVHGCNATTNSTVNQPAVLAGNITATDSVTCNGTNTGAINISVTGGTPVYTYDWSNGNTTQNINSLAAGTYTVTVTDVHGCTATTNSTVKQPVTLTASVAATDSVTCNGSSTGSINISVSGGTPVYTYNWSNGKTTQNINSLAAGTYIVTVTDVHGCSTTTSSTIYQPAILTTSITATDSATCNGTSTGSINISVSGGTPVYTYNWSNGKTTQNITNLAAGTYTVTVTDVHGCSATTSSTVYQPATLATSVTATDSATCNGSSTGSINISVNGGTPVYTYDWSNGKTTQNISSLAAGTYTVTVTDVHGCSATTSSTVYQPVSLAASISATDSVTCNGTSTGSINISVSGGTPVYTYHWSNGKTTQNISSLAAGTYTVTVTDVHGCSATTSSTIYQPATLTTSITATDSATCNGTSTGSINISVSGGTPVYAYDWSNGKTTQNISSLGAGTYTVTVTDVHGCTATTSSTVKQPATLTASVAATDSVTCNGTSTGSINISVSGGTPVYTYNWSNGKTTQNINSLAAGTYIVTVTDVHGCSTTTSSTIYQPATLTTSITATDSATCNGTSTGSINISVSGGTPVYSYSWSNGKTTQNISNLATGTYTVTVTDVHGCSTSISSTVKQPATLAASMTATDSVTCNGTNTGSINISVSGGTPVYSYSWSNGSSTQNINSLAAGTYTVTVTDVHGCSSTTSSTVSQPVVLNINITGIDSVTCFGGNNGSVSIGVSGGTPVYSYNWSNGATTQNISNVVAGPYTVTVTDVHGCSATVSGNVGQPSARVLSAVITNVNCGGDPTGAIVLSVTGGTPGYTFVWSNGATTQSLNSLSGGNYTVTVTDAHGCVDTATYTVHQNSQMVVTVSTVAAKCNGLADGSASVTVSGGTPPYTYIWDNGATTSSTSGLLGGAHSVVVIDSFNCSQSTSFNINQPKTLKTVDTITAVSCNAGSNGAVKIGTTGGTTPYTYIWSNGATTQDISNLKAGTYDLTVTDAQGCQNTLAASVKQPNLLVISATSDSVSCYGLSNGAVYASLTGGMAPYAYQWNTGSTVDSSTGLSAGSYTLTVTDGNGCTASLTEPVGQPPVLATTISANDSVTCFGGNNGFVTVTTGGGTLPYTYSWNNGTSSDTLSNVAAGNYTVTVTDVYGCSATVSATVSQPALLTTTITATDSATCNGTNTGGVQIATTGGTGPYSYNWSNGATTQNIGSLIAGTYTVTVTDVHGCSATISDNVYQAGTLTASITARDSVTCFGTNTGSITISATGGTGPYSYNWSNGATTQNLNNVAAGSYTITVTDVHGCNTTANSTINQPAVLAAHITVTDSVTCNGTSTGLINISVSGGTPVYTYHWSNGKTTQNINSLAAGTYIVTVTDVHGCSTTTSSTIYQPATLTTSITATDSATCNGTSTGSINISVSGGTPVYTYNWSNGKTTQNISNLATGTYTVTVTDVHGCSTSISSTVKQPATLAASMTATDSVTCNGTNTGSINISVSGGTPVYSYSWSNGSSTQNINSLAAGTYTVTVTDVHGCSSTTSSTVSQPVVLNINITGIDSVTCFGGNNGSVSIGVSGGTPVYSYNWSNGATTQNISNVVAGPYTVTVTDVHGCSATVSGNVGQPSARVLSAVITNVNCGGDPTGAIVLSVTGGTPGYTFVWSNGATTQSLNSLSGGNYTVTVTDAHGCVDTATYTVHQNSQMVVTVSTVAAKCNGLADGSASVTVSGGTPPYTYIWDNGATTSSTSGLLGGAHSVVVIDSFNCSQSTSFNINQPKTLKTVDTITAVSCNAGSNGAVKIGTTGGTTPYTYIWSNGATTQDISNLKAGTYDLTVTDAQGCQNTLAASVKQPNLLVISATSDSVSCYGLSNGAVYASLTGGMAPYAYQWNTGSTVDSSTGLSAGSYTLTVTDGNGCTASLTEPVGQPPVLATTISANDSVTCFGGNNGFVTVTTGGGTLPYTYSWNNGTSSDTLSNVAAGNYTVTVTDVYGCSATVSATVSQPALLTTTITATDSATCNGTNTGGVQIATTGGTGPYSYNWSNGATTQNIGSLIAGTYTVTVTDVHGCSATISDNVYQAGTLTASITARDSVTCFGTNTGSITISATGGTGPYSYNWSNGATTQNLNNVAAGSYTITVTDVHGCNTTANSTINQPAVLAVNVTETDSVTCNGTSTGAITVSTSGGTSSYTYNWSDGGSTSNSLTNIPAGPYTVTVTDVHGCSATASSTVNQPAILAVNVTETDSATCNGTSTGAITVAASGGTPVYIYNWSNGGSITNNLSNIPAGPYTVTVTDVHGCSTTASSTISQPATLTVNVTETDSATCSGTSTGAITVAASGGTPVYTYNWSNGGSTTNNLTNIPAGPYTVTVTDVHGCSATTGSTVNQAGTLNINVTATDSVTCFGTNTGSITVAATGGTSIYTYNWSNGGSSDDSLNNVPAGNYSVTVNDGHGCSATTSATVYQPAVLNVNVTETDSATCNGTSTGAIIVAANGGTPVYTYNWSNGNSTTDSLTNVPAGPYTVTVTDLHGCSATASSTVNQAGTLNVSITATDSVTCFGTNTGSITVAATGGTSIYTYNWSNGGSTNNSLANIPAGTYSVTVNDNHGCSATTNATVNQPSTLAVNVTATDSITCNGTSTGAIIVAATGGTPIYTYNWSNGGSADDSLNNVPAGNYTVTVTDVHGCNATASATVNQPATLAASVIETDSVTCNGTSTGAIIVAATGGTPIYTYNWSNGGSADDSLNNVPAGNYTVTVTDVHGCSATASSTVSQPATLAVNATATDSVTCNGTSTGAIIVAATGGTPIYTYNWSNGGSTDDSLNNVPAGNYTVTVTDVHGCSATASSTVSQPATLAVNVTATDSVTCNGTSTGVIIVAASGGTPIYTYNWSDGGSSDDSLNNVPAGNYTVTVTDVHGCSATTSSTVYQPASLAVNVTATDSVTCNGTSTGVIIVAASGGTPIYTYNWSDGGSSDDSLNNVPAGNYTVTVTDVHGCSAAASSTVNQPVTLAVNVTATDSVTCNGTSTGAIIVAATGGTPIYTYNWSNGGSTDDSLNNVPAGNYTVTVTDVHGCSATASSTVSQPATLAVNVTATDSVTCNGTSTGVIIVAASGGTPIYTYNWSDGGSSDDSLNNVPAGNYTVTVTDVHGCSAAASSTVNQPVTLAVNVTATDSVTCNGTSTGAIIVAATGGTPIYTYNWSNGGSTDDSLNNVPAGNYTVTVTDVHGCSATANSTVNQPATLAVNVTETDSATCYGTSTGAITVSASGGTPVYNYNWSNGGSTTNSLSNIPAGNYTVTVTDVHGCSATANPVVDQPALLMLNIAATDSVRCFGTRTGAIFVSAAGGTPTYTYTWSNGASTTDSLYLVPVGTYSVTVTDIHGCSATTSSTVDQPVQLTVDVAEIDSAGCNGSNTGAIQVSVSGGTPVYTYSWSNDGSTTDSLNNVAAGKYTVTVTDVHRCSASVSATVKQPVALSVIVAATDSVTCYGASTGAINLSVDGGTPKYTYNWSNGGSATNTLNNIPSGSYSVTVTDANGCSATTSSTVNQPAAMTVNVTETDSATCNGNNTGAIKIAVNGGTPVYTYYWSNGWSTTDSMNNLPAGSYTVTVVDVHGCGASTGATVSQPAPLSVNVTLTDSATCNGSSTGAITVTVNGGTPGYTYNWSNGASTTNNLSNIPAGNYTVTATDIHGCSATASATISQPASLAVNVAAMDSITCSNTSTGSITVSASGGTPAYTYNWSNAGSTTNIVANIPAGTYTVTVTDVHGCSATTSATVNQPDLLTLTVAEADSVLCYGTSTGIAKVFASGGTPVYTYNWGGTGTNTDAFHNLSAGTYDVTVTDAHGCTATTSAIVNQPPQLAINIMETDSATCFGTNTGAIKVAANGGTPVYTYNWSGGGSITNSMTNIVAGLYTVTVTDVHGCTATASASVSQSPLLAVNVTETDSATCNGSSTGAITVSASGGTPAYSYNWSNAGSATNNLSNVQAGNYTVTVTDIHGCSATVSATVSQPALLNVNVTANDSVTCNGGNTGAISVSASGGTPVYTYNWSNGGSTTNSLNNIPAGNYNITVTDVHGCAGTTNINVGQPNVLTATVSAIGSVSCFGESDGSITVAPNGGTAPYNYRWNNNASTTDSLTGVSAGNYSVTITDIHGCSATVSGNVDQPSAPLHIVSDSISNVACNDSGNGTISVIMGGGTAPYSYNWSNGTTTNIINGLSQGNYMLTVTDAHGCTLILMDTIKQPKTVTLSVTALDSILCHGGTGAIIVQAYGGDGPYTYSWNNGNISDSLSKAIPGNYSVVAHDANGCPSDTADVSLIDPAQLTLSFNGIAGSCANYTDGIVTVTVKGGITPYTYKWNIPGEIASFSDLGPGTYQVTATDAHGCAVTGSDSLAAIAPINLTSNAQLDSATCNSSNGSIQIQPVGGTTPYTYLWSNGGTASNLTGLSKGSYSLTVMDVNGCTNSATYSIGSTACGGNPGPTAVPDTAQTPENSSVVMPVLVNDYDSTGSTITLKGVSSGPTHGTLIVDTANGTVTYIPDSNFIGVDSFTYVICDPYGCDSATDIVIVIPYHPDIVIPNGISPNGDGINDYFVIQNIGRYPGSKLVIFNRWGNSIWQSNNYVNDWHGTNQDNEPLPDGTYFYVLTIPNGPNSNFEGFVTIHR